MQPGLKPSRRLAGRMALVEPSSHPVVSPERRLTGARPPLRVALPAVFDPVELMAKDRDGCIVPYFKTGGHRWTDGGLQADLPKARLAELFNVNQFIVSQVSSASALPPPRFHLCACCLPHLTSPRLTSPNSPHLTSPCLASQVNPVAALFVAVDSGIPFLTEAMHLLKNQLVGFARGFSSLAQGRLARPGGVRLWDILLQEYEGTVTFFPHWSLSELSGFIANFDAQRMEAYELDGARAVWQKLQVRH